MSLLRMLARCAIFLTRFWGALSVLGCVPAAGGHAPVNLWLIAEVDSSFIHSPVFLPFQLLVYAALNCSASHKTRQERNFFPGDFKCFTGF